MWAGKMRGLARRGAAWCPASALPAASKARAAGNLMALRPCAIAWENVFLGRRQAGARATVPSVSRHAFSTTRDSHGELVSQGALGENEEKAAKRKKKKKKKKLADSADADESEAAKKRRKRRKRRRR